MGTRLTLCPRLFVLPSLAGLPSAQGSHAWGQEGSPHRALDWEPGDLDLSAVPFQASQKSMLTHTHPSAYLLDPRGFEMFCCPLWGTRAPVHLRIKTSKGGKLSSLRLWKAKSTFFFFFSACGLKAGQVPWK